MARGACIEFLEAFRNHSVIIVIGDERSDKTTAVPRWCLEEIRNLSPPTNSAPFSGVTRVVCTQPKRAAAISAATRVAEEMHVSLGEEVGFAIRFESRCGPETSLKYVTDGVLLREMEAKPFFEDYRCIVLDEVQERTAATDILMGLLKRVTNVRSDLKIVVMTASPDVDHFQSYFINAPVVHVRDPMNPGEILLPPGPRSKEPEILRNSLLNVVLELKKLGEKDPSSFEFLDPPPTRSITEALEVLDYLGALDDAGGLTRFGRIMAGFPLDPRLTRALIASDEFSCSAEVCSIIAMLSAPEIFLDPPKIDQELIHDDGDHLTFLNAYRAWKENSDRSERNAANQSLVSRAQQVDSQLISIMKSFDLGHTAPETLEVDSVLIRQALLAGYFTQVAFRVGGAEYRTIKDNQIVKLHPSTCLKERPEWVIYHERLSDGQEKYIRIVTAIEPEWLSRLAPRFVNESTHVHEEARDRILLASNRGISKLKA